MTILNQVDDLRMLNSTNTQLRRLEVISALIKNVGNRHLPIELLKTQVIKWSYEFEKLSPVYHQKNGKLTDSGKETSAFNKYISLIKEMGLIKQLGSVVSLTILGNILYEFIKGREVFSDEISESEKLFYSYLLFTKDADYVLLLINLILENPLETKQSQLQSKFKESLKQRLKNKSDYANLRSSLSIYEKIRTVTIEWRNAESYSEHIIAPRAEWLIDIGILKKSNGFYTLSKEGMEFKDSLPEIGTNINDINNEWLNMYCFSSFGKIFKSSAKITKFNDLQSDKQIELIGECLMKVSNLFRSGNSLRIGVQQSLIYSSIYSFCHHDVVLEFDDVVRSLSNPLEYNGRLFQIKSSARITEAYITIKLT